ncbi:serine/arginine repetitive matrix protein 1-like [Patiria miniata]|uniref:Uncharacterized protein n=1 Tax=Patiria miniata TaxID=46514 RepID=A0A914B5S4_PATMI|nr:serine/arginine repetitive matrix protein 1-like [Patiria miniata]
MTVLKASRAGRRRGRSSSATPSAAGLKAGPTKSSRASSQSRSRAKQSPPRKSHVHRLKSSRVKTSVSGVRRSTRARGHHKFKLRNRTTLGHPPTTEKPSPRPTSASSRPKLRRTPPFTRLSSLPASSHYFLRSSSSTKTVPRSPGRRRIAFAGDLTRYSLRSLTGKKRERSWDSSASDSLVSRPPGTRARSIRLSNRDSSQREDTAHPQGKKRKMLPQPRPPPNTPCSSPETPTTPPSKRARSSPVLRAKSTGRKPLPRRVPASRSGTKRRRSGRNQPKENDGPSAKRHRRNDDILTDLKSRLDAIRAASGKRDRVALPTVHRRRQGAPRSSKNAVSVIAVARKLKRQLAEATPTICDMSLRNGKIKLN